MQGRGKPATTLYSRARKLALALLVLASPAWLHAQTPAIAEPFKVGTFLIDGELRIALVLRDALIVDILAANAALERDPAYPSCRCRTT